MSDHIDAHKFSSHHREQLEKDRICGCFFCEKIFTPGEILDWYEEEGTAVCPFCGIDSVIGESSGYPITNEFMEKMHDYWFGIHRRNR